ncbi:MAG: metal ABC transporter permease [Treponemataceae bacterium]
MNDILAVPAFVRALAALTASGLAFPALGTFILCLELIPARFAVMHVSLLGAAVGLMVGVDPMLAAVTGAVASGFLIARASEQSSVSAGGPLGLVMTLSLGLAFIIFYKADIHAIEAFNLFWGNVLALTETEAILTIIAAAILIIAVAVFFKEIRAVLYDRELARASGLPARAIYYGIILAVCLGIGLAMRLTGALMVDASTILPALAARNMKRSLGGTLLWGAAFGLVMNLGGFALSLALDLPVSPAVIVIGAVLVIGTGALGKRDGWNLPPWPKSERVPKKVL